MILLEEFISYQAHSVCVFGLKLTIDLLNIVQWHNFTCIKKRCIIIERDLRDVLAVGKNILVCV